MTLQICIMIKNGSETIERVLKSWYPYTDHFCILDTGSTDGSQDIIRKTLLGANYSLYEEPFIDFSSSRNRCLELGQLNYCTWQLMLDDSWAINYGPKLLNVLQNIPAQIDSCYLRVYLETGIEYLVLRLFRTSAEITFKGLVHEQPIVKCALQIKCCYITDIEGPDQFKRSKDRRIQDLLDTRDSFHKSMNTQETADYIACINDPLSSLEHKVLCTMCLPDNICVPFINDLLITDTNRKGELYLKLWSIEKKKEYIDLALKSGIPKNYGIIKMNIYTEIIPRLYWVHCIHPEILSIPRK